MKTEDIEQTDKSKVEPEQWFFNQLFLCMKKNLLIEKSEIGNWIC